MPFLVNCFECGKDASVAPSRYNGRIHFFCSSECASAYSKAEPNKTCPVCGKRFHVKPYRRKRARGGAVCCTRECLVIKKSEDLTGDKSHQFGLLGELTPSRKAAILVT